MEVKATQIDSINATINVKISQNSIKNEIQNLALKASKNITVHGFRPGKAPVAVIIKRYQKEFTKDAEQNLLKKSIEQALKDLNKDNKDLFGEPYFEKFDKIEENIEADIILSFKPEIKLDGYEKLIPNYTMPKVDDKELNDKKQIFLNRFAKHESIKSKRAIKKGDFVKFDFEGFIDGVAFEGGKAENTILEIGSNQFIPGFEDSMIGLKPNEEKEIKVTFPSDYNRANLAGKEAIFKLKIHDILKLKLPELNKEFFKSLFPNTTNPDENFLNEKLKEQVINEKLLKLINDELKPQFADILLKNFIFDVPRGVVEQETDIQFRNAWASFSKEEMEELNSNPTKAKEKRNSFKEEAINSVKLTFIVNELAKLRNIIVSDQEVAQTVYFEAYRYGINPQEMFKNYKNQGLLPAIKMSLVEEKLFNDIFIKKEETEKVIKKTPKKETKEKSTKTKKETK